MSEPDLGDPRLAAQPGTEVSTLRLVRRRMLWAAAFFGSATVLGLGWVMFGGYEYVGLAPLGFVVLVVAALFVVLGLVACVGALVAGFSSGAKRSALAMGAGIGMIAITVVGALMVTFPPVSLFGLALIFVIIFVDRPGDRDSPMTQLLSAPGRSVLALPFTVLTLAVVAAGVLHITVWDPLAKVPGLSLDEIYGAMAAANESPIVFLIAGGAAFWGIAAMIFLALVGLPLLRTFFTARRIVVIGLLGVSAAAGFVFWAGFGVGMSLADTFMISGGDAAPSGGVIAIVGQLAFVAALLVGLPPRRHRGELPAATAEAGTAA